MSYTRLRFKSPSHGRTFRLTAPPTLALGMACIALAACGPEPSRYSTPMRISLLEHFDVAERHGPSGYSSDSYTKAQALSRAKALSQAKARSDVEQGCASSLVYHFVMPETAKLIATGSLAGGHEGTTAILSIHVTDVDGVRRAVVSHEIDAQDKTLSLDESLGSTWRDMMKLEINLSCDSNDDDLRILWSQLQISGTRPTPPATPSIVRDRYNVLVILLDSLRADHIQPYGAKTVATPQLQALADRGVSFLTARTTASWTRPAAASLLTAQHSLNHGVLSLESKLPQDIPYLPAILKKNGYETILIANNVMVSSAFGFDRGFSRVFNHFGFAVESEQRHYRDPVQNANDVWNKYIAPAASVADQRPFFVYLHERDPHAPYRPPPPYDEMYAKDFKGQAPSDFMGIGKLRIWPHLANPALIEKLDGLYSGEISYMDRYVGTLIERLEQRNLKRKTLVVFVSDHGEEFWEHDSVGHGHTVYDELLKVPLIMRLEGVLPEGLATRVAMDLADVTPTILDLLGIDTPPTLQGSTLLPYLFANPSSHEPGSDPIEDVPPREHFSTAQATSPRGTTTPLATSLVYRDWKLIHKPAGTAPEQWQLFDLASDPGEHEDISTAHPVLVGTLDQMRRWMRRSYDATQRMPDNPDDTIPFDPATEQNLRALGYIE